MYANQAPWLVLILEWYDESPSLLLLVCAVFILTSSILIKFMIFAIPVAIIPLLGPLLKNTYNIVWLLRLYNCHLVLLTHNFRHILVVL